MPNRRRLNLEKYGITQRRYEEMRAFCLQYPEWQEKLKDIRSLRGVSTDREVVQSGMVGNPTEKAALSSMIYTQKIEAVERALKTVVGDEQGIYEPMLLNITRGVRYENINIPISRKNFFMYRTAFFVNLDKII